MFLLGGWSDVLVLFELFFSFFYFEIIAGTAESATAAAGHFAVTEARLDVHVHPHIFVRGLVCLLLAVQLLL